MTCRLLAASDRTAVYLLLHHQGLQPAGHMLQFVAGSRGNGRSHTQILSAKCCRVFSSSMLTIPRQASVQVEMQRMCSAGT